jgi:Dyp-type peroxidase family
MASGIAIKLNQVLDETDDGLRPFFNDLQGNILKGHGRHHTVNRFFTFDKTKAKALKAALGSLARGGLITSSAKQLSATEAFRRGGPADTPTALFFLSFSGYKKLGIPDKQIPQGDAFRAGMKARGGNISDPAASQWEAGFQKDIDALLLVGMPDADEAEALADSLSASLLAAGASVPVEVAGHAIFNAASEGIEHFGYVDGRSQPLFLKSEIDHEISVDGASKWNPRFAALATVLVRDEGSADENGYGSFFVFRKLRQNVKVFKEGEESLENAIAAAGGDPTLAGPMVVGRFEDGTPLMVATTTLGQAVTNNFNYDDDPDGLICPFQAHIRKTNPRGDVRRNIPPASGSDVGDRQPIMARRGITYGGDRPRDDEGLPADRPMDGFGLLFMAYQKSIEDQFEFTQRTWANNQNFVRPGTGIDPVIGQGSRTPYNWPLPGGAGVSHPFDQAVTLLGGEYFFAPSISFLRALCS